MGHTYSAWSAEQGRRREASVKRAYKWYSQWDVLLLGVSGAGKTTLTTQLRNAKEGGRSEAERAACRGEVYEHVVRAARLAVEVMQSNGAQCAEQYNRENVEIILAYNLDTANLLYLPAEFTTAVHQLWADAAFKGEVYEYGGDSVLMDSAAYFFEEVLRIGAPGYVPTDTDIIRVYRNTIGIVETRFSKDTWQWVHLFDVGTWVPECKKWIQDFEETAIIVFCVALSDYDRASVDGKHENRMLESIAMFENVVNLGTFANTPIILFFNKLDVFRAKLAKLPLQWHFPDYSGGSDVDAACKYIEGKFTGVIRVHRSKMLLTTHIITATDAQTTKLLSDKLKRTFNATALEMAGFM
ncbi:hypothetical protein HYPSUDRAFT_220657 [Hypholoma sublateritium FD-334 SS-4]|uniref:G-protein alpha subunit n=1 Tax=Hypholoma sublateritium (strain FD-334 SS-4) TaxID=945553 RepID=A0A0D2N448_HYPSF|nr:hypothetical protein HYPSUDRAFT_220657 [Hypholoma sublateritium FD-334 SS-4]